MQIPRREPPPGHPPPPLHHIMPEAQAPPPANPRQHDVSTAVDSATTPNVGRWTRNSAPQIQVKPPPPPLPAALQPNAAATRVLHGQPNIFPAPQRGQPYVDPWRDPGSNFDSDPIQYTQQSIPHQTASEAVRVADQAVRAANAAVEREQQWRTAQARSQSPTRRHPRSRTHQSTSQAEQIPPQPNPVVHHIGTPPAEAPRSPAHRHRRQAGAFHPLPPSAFHPKSAIRWRLSEAYSRRTGRCRARSAVGCPCYPRRWLRGSLRWVSPRNTRRGFPATASLPPASAGVSRKRPTSISAGGQRPDRGPPRKFLLQYPNAAGARRPRAPNPGGPIRWVRPWTPADSCHSRSRRSRGIRGRSPHRQCPVRPASTREEGEGGSVALPGIGQATSNLSAIPRDSAIPGRPAAGRQPAPKPSTSNKGATTTARPDAGDVPLLTSRIPVRTRTPRTDPQLRHQQNVKMGLVLLMTATIPGAAVTQTTCMATLGIGVTAVTYVSNSAFVVGFNQAIGFAQTAFPGGQKHSPPPPPLQPHQSTQQPMESSRQIIAKHYRRPKACRVQTSTLNQLGKGIERPLQYCCNGGNRRGHGNHHATHHSLLPGAQRQREAHRNTDGSVSTVMPSQPAVATTGNRPPNATKTAGLTPPPSKSTPHTKPEIATIKHFAYFVRFGGNLRQLKCLEQFADLTKDEYIESLEDIIRADDLD